MSARVLVAGLGTIFLGDDGFGVEVARRLAAVHPPETVRVTDFGVRAPEAPDPLGGGEGAGGP